MLNFFTVDPYFWAMSFVGLSKSAKNDKKPKSKNGNQKTKVKQHKSNIEHQKTNINGEENESSAYDEQHYDSRNGHSSFSNHYDSRNGDRR